MKWYADDSDIKTIKDMNIPNMVLIGGIVVNAENERALREAVEGAKRKFGDKRWPVKWNFKDLKGKYEEQNKVEHYERMLEQMPDIRRAIFDAASNIQFIIIVSAVIGYSSDKKILIELKNDLCRYVFSNGLMRFSQHVKECRPNRAEVVLDWPDKNFSKPFDSEYAVAYSYGKSKDGISYISGSLDSLLFNDSISYTRMSHSTLMQFSDMVLAATREFIQHALDESKSGHGIKLLNTLASKFRGFPNDVMGRGIIVNSQATKNKAIIQNKFQELYLNTYSEIFINQNQSLSILAR